jgi:spermidine synthase
MASRAFFISLTSTDPNVRILPSDPGIPDPHGKVAALPRFLLPLVVFLTGACVLVVEVLAVRVFSPFYGNTIYTVSSVISVILLALSVGYYAGGVAADRRPTRERFFGLILASGVVLLLLHFVGRLTLPAVSGALSIQVGPLVSASLMFLLPALLLGMVSPYAIKLQSLSVPQQGIGSVAGTIFFWSTLGSISGSLLAGFVLIPAAGVDRVLVAVGVLLVLLGSLPLVIFRLATIRAVASGAAAVVLTFAGAQFAAAPPLVDAGTIVYQSDGLYQQITIYEGQYLGRPARFLLLDRSESGAMFLDSPDPADLVYDYTKYYSLYKVFTPTVRNALVLGGGAYSIPKALLHELPDAVVDVAEIEPSFLDLAKKYFAATESPRLRNYVEDGRRFLQDSATQYDLIFGDVYYSYFSVPPQFTTREFFALAKSRLRAEGVFIANMIGDLSRREPSLILAEIRTFQTVFPNSYFFAVESAERTDQLQNITLVGYNSEQRIDVTRPPVTTHPDDLVRFLRYKRVDVDRRFELSPYPVLTDDFSPVEYLTARVLGRAFDDPTEADGDEMRAVAEQVLRYGPRGPGTQGREKVRDFLFAEMSGLSPEVTLSPTTIAAGLFLSESTRTVLAAPIDDAAAVALLVELTRSLIFSPVPPATGVDVLFFDRGAAPPPPATVIENPCGAEAGPARCDAERLGAAAQRLLARLRRVN